MSSKLLPVSLVSLIFLSLTLMQVSPVQAQAQSNLDLRLPLQAVDEEALRKNVKFFSDLGSRVTGYPGFFKAAEYIIKTFADAGVKPYGADEDYREYYDITIPLDQGATISLSDGSVIQAYVLWPNHVNPSPYSSPPIGDLMIYAGSGDIEDFNEKNVTGKFVLMDFNSKWMFRTAAMYGAKGVIFIPGFETTRAEAITKLYALPLNFPKLYVSYQDGQKLLNLCKTSGEVKIHVESMMTWEKIRVPNIVGFIEGTGPLAGGAIVISAYYDSWSVVPKLSPGATDSLGIATLLELAKFLAKNPPKRSVILVALSGHWQSAWGAREYAERHFLDIGSQIKMFVGLNLISEKDQIGIYNIGSLYAYNYPESLNARYVSLVAKIFLEYLPAMQRVLGGGYGASFVDGILNSHPAYISSSPPIFFEPRTMDSEPFTVASFGGGFGFCTVNANPMYSKTPLDTHDRINYRNLLPQVQFIFGTMYGLLNEEILPMTASTPARFRIDQGYVTLNITAVEYDMRTDFAIPITAESRPEVWKSLIILYSSSPIAVRGEAGFTATSAVGGAIDIVAIPDKFGRVTIRGLKPYTTGDVRVYVVNRTNGKIEWAPNTGVYASRAAATYTFRIDSERPNKMAMAFPCGSIVLFNILNPDDLGQTLSVSVYNYIAHGSMISWGYTFSSYAADYMFFVEPNTPAEVIVRLASDVYGVLVNSTSSRPEGWGYRVEAGETLVITQTPYQLAKNTFLLNNERLEIAQRYSTLNPSILLYHQYATEYLKLADTGLETRQYGLTYGSSFAAWGYERRAYLALMTLIQEAIYTIVFFFLLVIPFTYLAERLLLNQSGIRRVLSILLIFGVCMATLGAFHPGFHLATNTLMVLLGFGIVVIVIPIVTFIGSGAMASARALRTSILGLHEAEVSRVGVASSAFSVGINNMRKRRLRTSLTVVSIVLLVFALISFTSFASLPTPRQTSRSVDKVPYEGILIRRIPWSGIPAELWLQIKAEFSEKAVVAPRGWVYPPLGPEGGGGSIVFSPELITDVRALLCLSPEEPTISGINNTLIRGRWFTEKDFFSCMISQRTAENLTIELDRTIDVGSTVTIWGMGFTVVGLFDGSLLWDGKSGFIDLDDEAITPREIIGGQVGEEARPPHLVGDRVIIIPYETAWRIVGYMTPMSVAIKPSDPREIPTIALKLAYRISASDIFYGLLKTEGKGEIYAITTRYWFSLTGLQNLPIPMIISAFVILNTMIGSVHERTREISTYVSVGLSPLHVAFMFLSESIVYAALGSMLGYTTGIIGISVLTSFQVYPEFFFPNYSSLIIIYVTSLSAGITILSSIYPAAKASRLVTPSMERRWKIPKPGGNEWTIPLPFVAHEKELLGIINFITEFLFSFGGERTAIFKASKAEYEEQIVGEKQIKRLKVNIRLAPFDMGITQNLIVEAVSAEHIYNINLYLILATGTRSVWITSNKVFIDLIRKQLLIWRALPPSEKENYEKRNIKDSLRSEVAP